MESYKRYVSYFDMLGTRAAVKSNLFNTFDALSSIYDSKEKIYKYKFDVDSIGKRVILRDRIKYFIFSDTIIGYSYKDEPEDLWAILFFSVEIFSQCLHKCVPMRGSIASGDFLFNLDKNIFLGQPLIDAHDNAEKAQWLGITLSDCVANEIIKNDIKGGDNVSVVTEWDVPLKDGFTKKQYVINWLATHSNNFTSSPPYSPEQFYEGFKSLFGDFDLLKDADKKKYDNTVRFINKMLENKNV